MAKDQTVVADESGNVTVTKRNNISVDKTEVVLEGLVLSFRTLLLH